MNRTIMWIIISALILFGAGEISIAQTDTPNIVVIWGDDIGRSNLSIYTQGMMGYQTPNIDRVAHEGMLFTDYYAEQEGAP